MAQSTTVSYHSDRCDHTTEIEFSSDEDPFDSKRMGCPKCGATGNFTRVNDDSDNGGDDEHETDPTTDVETSVVEQGGESMDMEDTEVSLDDREYQQLRSIAARIDSVETNQSHDELLSALRGVDDSALASAITEVNNDE